MRRPRAAGYDAESAQPALSSSAFCPLHRADRGITPARKFRMLLHINPTHSEGNAPDPSLAHRVGI